MKTTKKGIVLHLIDNYAVVFNKLLSLYDIGLITKAFLLQLADKNVNQYV